MNCVRKVKYAITARNLIDPGSRILVAVSGGPDSMALLTILNELKGEMRLDLAAAHFNHGIRPESEKEQAAVERHASSIGIPSLIGSADVPSEARRRKTGIEETARLLRYRFLENAADERGAGAVALGHTRDDQIETIFHRILRGTGWRGLMGIPAKRGLFVRPLLDCARAELIDFLRSNRISYMIDKSNRDDTYYRNRIRNRLLPYLRRHFNPSVDESIIRLHESLDEGWRLLEKPLLLKIPDRRPDGTVALELNELTELNDFEIYLLIDLVLRERYGMFQDFEKKHFDAAKRLIRKSQSGRRVRFPHGITITREQRELLISPHEFPPSINGEILVPGPGRYELPQWGLSLEVERVNRTVGSSWSDREVTAARIRFPIRVRGRRPGDRLVPFGMKGRKKLSDLFIDRKIPLRLRDRYPVFADALGPFWIPGVVTGERTRITPNIRRIIHLRLSDEKSAGPGKGRGPSRRHRAK
jgi:tRNA(Ile)-lysidine synthase